MYIPDSKLLYASLLPNKKQNIGKSTQKYMEKYKLQLLKWINSLDEIQRASVMTIKDKTFLQYLSGMISKGKYDKMGYYLGDKIYSRDVYRYKSTGQYTPKQMQNSQQQILNNIIILKGSHQITFRRSFLRQYKVLLEHISVMTKDLIFTFFSFDESAIRNSVWFIEKQYHSLCQWLIYAFQNQILKSYLMAKQMKLYKPIQRAYQIYSFSLPMIKSNYFSVEKIKKIYKDKRIQNNQQGRKNRELNIHKIMELCEEKTNQQLIEDILFEKLVKHEDPSYYIYLDTIFQLVQQSYNDHKFNEILNFQEIQENKPKISRKRNRMKKNKNKKKQEQQTNVLHKDTTDDTLTQTKSLNEEMKLISQPQFPVKIQSEQRADKQQTSSQISKDTKLVSQTMKDDKQQEITQQQHKVQASQKKKKPANKVNNYISNCLKDYIDEFSQCSNKLLGYRKLVFNRLQKSILSIFQKQKIYYNFHLRVFGSCALGLSTSESDIDMVLLIDTNDNLDAYILEMIHKQLQKQQWVVDAKFINSSVPIVKLEADLSIDYSINNKNYNIQNNKMKKVLKFQVDLSIETKNSQNHQGLKTTQYALSLLSQHNNLRYITLLLKIFIKARGLNLTFHGGINSYVLFLIVYAFLKNFNFLQKAQLFVPLKELLHYYSSQFEIESTIIDPRLQKPINNSNVPVLQRLTIMDPLCHKEKQINTNSSQINKIFGLFGQMHEMLIKFKEEVDQSDKFDKKEQNSMFVIFKNRLNGLMADIF